MGAAAAAGSPAGEAYTSAHVKARGKATFGLIGKNCDLGKPGEQPRAVDPSLVSHGQKRPIDGIPMMDPPAIAAFQDPFIGEHRSLAQTVDQILRIIDTGG
ncbi:MAG TPA: hypothetical protein VE735_05705 [Gammaproteobacteria bacterium]|nr:hypothetical protein [Gammaproteobacteria bacterium]